MNTTTCLTIDPYIYLATLNIPCDWSNKQTHPMNTTSFFFLFGVSFLFSPYEKKKYDNSKGPRQSS